MTKKYGNQHAKKVVCRCPQQSLVQKFWAIPLKSRQRPRRCAASGKRPLGLGPLPKPDWARRGGSRPRRSSTTERRTKLLLRSDRSTLSARSQILSPNRRDSRLAQDHEKDDECRTPRSIGKHDAADDLTKSSNAGKEDAIKTPTKIPERKKPRRSPRRRSPCLSGSR